MGQEREKSATRFGLGAVALWSTVATAFEVALDHLSPLQLLALASLCSWLVLGLAMLVSGTSRVSIREGWRRAIPAGLANPLAYYLILFAAYQRLPGQEAMALNYTWALTMSVLAVPILRHRLRGKDLLAVALAYSGVWTIATRGAVWSVNFADGTGVALALLSTLVWALYWLANARDPRPPLVAQWQNFSVACPILIALVLQAGPLPTSPEGLAAAAYVGVFEMGVAFLLWQEATRRTAQTARIANLIFLSPPVSLVLLYLVRHEPLLPSTAIGLVLILGGLAVQNLGGVKRRKAQSPSPPHAGAPED